MFYDSVTLNFDMKYKVSIFFKKIVCNYIVKSRTEKIVGKIKCNSTPEMIIIFSMCNMDK